MRNEVLFLAFKRYPCIRDAVFFVRFFRNLFCKVCFVFGEKSVGFFGIVDDRKIEFGDVR